MEHMATLACRLAANEKNYSVMRKNNRFCHRSLASISAVETADLPKFGLEKYCLFTTRCSCVGQPMSSPRRYVYLTALK
jgi:hypothetical protein